MSLLEKMSYNNERIFDIDEISPGEFRIMEACDQYFEAILSANELERLGQEIIDMARKSKDK